VYIDTALPFGLRSAPKIFTAISDTLEWILVSHGMSSCLHYLDSESPRITGVRAELKPLLRVSDMLPIVTHKVEGPTTLLSSWAQSSTLCSSHRRSSSA
jgi:hypothetical protein